MADLSNITQWETGIFQLETTTPAQGGPGGISNLQAQQLSNRTNWLKSRVDPLYTIPFEQISATRAVVATDARKHFYFRGASPSNAIAFSPTVTREALVASDTDRFTVRFYPPTAPGVTGISVQFRIAGSGTWLSTTPDRQVPVSPVVFTAFPSSANYEFRIVTRGTGGVEGQATATFNTSTQAVTPLTDATLPLITAVENGTGFYFMNQEQHELWQGRLTTSGSDVIADEHVEVSSLFVKPGRSGFAVIRDGSKWRVIGQSHKSGVGKVEHQAMFSPPRGYLVCDGRAVSRSVFADLFGVIGTLYGSGDGSVTFNLPDLRAEFIRGWDALRGIDPSRDFGSAQADELKSHRHTVRKINRQTGTSSTGFFAMDDNGNDGSEFTELTGGTETRPRNVALLPIIQF